jgi:hypothetical protein
MAKQTVEVVIALRNTATAIENSPDYQWGHMGSCNCGFLAQHVTHLNKSDIHQSAMERYGNWNEQLNDYCPTSGFRIDDIISAMIAFGFDTDDLKHLERLSDGRVLGTLPTESRNLNKNNKEDVIVYLRAWAGMVEEEIIQSITLEEYSLLVSEQIAEASA